ncbi:ATP-binding protein [Streptomyces arenae]|uniref:ATP-binding protein n=1 Tax=Streptomyces arenae TaxID=29301 RepID=UPI0026583193|nr:ATP-binding protein [Streptomyces arenae]MCG7206958.1 ATP-binding protein [Streptomyces arenae]
MDCGGCMPRRPWDLSFSAEPAEVSALRRLLRTHLRLWGLAELTESAQLCMSELVSNVITHVGPGTPTTLAVSVNGTCLRIEVHDPDTRALPRLIESTGDAEAGRGMALVASMSERWGVQLLPDRKITWVELASGLTEGNGHTKDVRVSRATSCLHLYNADLPAELPGSSRLSVIATEKVAIDVIADLLHWLRAHGYDADEALDRAQTQFEAETLRPAR